MRAKQVGSGHRMRNSRAAGIQRVDHALKMMGEPKVIVAEIGDEFALGFLQLAIVGTSLMACVGREIDPSHPRVRDCADNLLRIVGAAIANHKQFELRHCLCQHALNGVRQDRAPIVSGNDHGDAW